MTTSSPEPSSPGRRVDVYEVIRPLGRGGMGNPVSALAWRPDHTLATGLADGEIHLLDPADGSLLQRGRMHGSIRNLRIQDGQLYAASAAGGVLTGDLSILDATRADALPRLWDTIAITWGGWRRQPATDRRQVAWR